jgi:hypothetical protein
MRKPYKEGILMIIRGKSLLISGGTSKEKFEEELREKGKKIIYTKKIITNDNIPIIKKKDSREFEKQYKKLLKNGGSIQYF